MEIQVQAQGSLTVVVLTGEIDGKTAPEVQSRLLPLAENGRKLVLDMQKVTFLSSAGLRVLFLLNRAASSGSGKIFLTGLVPELRDTMSVTGFLKCFQLFDSQEQAVEALR